jgi:glycosyltransferase involved in cell wall biosynthesis
MSNVADRLRQRLTRAATHPRTLAFVKRAVQAFPRVDHYIRLAHYAVVKRLRASPVSRIPVSAGGTPQFFVDVSHVAAVDGKTGIERVVRSLLLQLSRNPPTGHRIVPVRATADGALLSADGFLARLSGTPSDARAENAISVQAGDIWFTPDFEPQYPESVLKELRRHGVRLIFTVYDLLPLRTPQHFYSAQNLRFADWLAMVLRNADAVVCDSKTVADDLAAWLSEHPGSRSSPLPIGHFHLGADLEASSPTRGMTDAERALLSAVKQSPTLLMVGTIEPRKGHRAVLEALDELWAVGEDVQLVIVGKEGWRSHDLVRTMMGHRLAGKHLFWLPAASDETLQALYEHASALVAASSNEGFGLPLIEAAQHGLPIIARDIPVFREVAGEHAYYFADDRPQLLARDIAAWLRLAARGQAPPSRGMRVLRWADSANQVVATILGNAWDHVWSPPT